MSPATYLALASAILYFHFGVILFNVFWLVAIPLGAARGWSFVRNVWWRIAHLASLLVVAAQASAGRLCFLTIWQNELVAAAGGPPKTVPYIEQLVTRAVYWPLPMWAFIVMYLAVLFYAVALWWLVPPRLLKTAKAG